MGSALEFIASRLSLAPSLQMPYASLASRIEVNAGGRSENVYDGALVVGSHSPSA